MGVAEGAFHFFSHAAVADVSFFVDIFGCDRRPEAWPTGGGVELGCRSEQGVFAAGTAVQSRLMLIVKVAAVGKVGGRPAGDLVLPWSQQLFPFLVGAMELCY